jgi:ankyrin repeat protein
VKVLLEKGAQVNARTHEGTSALMNAAGGAGSKAIVEVLLDHGANVTAQDSKGRTALKYAMGANSEDKVQLLKQALAKTRKN